MDFRRFAVRFIRRNQIRGHDKNAPDPENSAIADEQADRRNRQLIVNRDQVESFLSQAHSHLNGDSSWA
jgi:hypothetical protein